MAALQFRPIVICGMPRSGTSLMRELLNTHGEVVIVDEFPLNRCPSAKGLVAELKQLLLAPHESWRGVELRELERRLAWVMAEVWAAGSRPALYGKFRQRRFRRFGMKTPSAELAAPEYEELLGSCRPQYVYCVRPAPEIYESLLSMPWGYTYEPAGVWELFQRSWAAVQRLANRGPNEVFIFPTHIASTDKAMRFKVVAALLRFLGLRWRWGLWRFLWRWPPVNVRAFVRQPVPLSTGEKQARLAGFAQLLREDPALERFFAHPPVGQGPTETAEDAKVQGR